MNVTFDHIDTYYLANTLMPAQLRHEVKRAREYIDSRDIIYSMPCCLLWSHEHTHLTPDVYGAIFQCYDFDYESYIQCCRDALKWMSNAKIKHEPETKRKPVDIESLKTRLDIVTEIEQYTNLRKSGNNRYLGRCPLHEDNHPSMTVYADKQSWHCFQCGRGGDIIDFIMAVEGVDFRRATSMLEST